MSEAVFARDHLMLGMQGWFLCFQGMFDICLLLCHLSLFQRALNLPVCRVHAGLQELNG